jgi:hypothetical protein
MAGRVGRPRKNPLPEETKQMELPIGEETKEEAPAEEKKTRKTKKAAEKAPAAPKVILPGQMLPMFDIKIKITLIEDILGSLPSDEEIYSSYIATKKAEKDAKIPLTEEEKQEEIASLLAKEYNEAAENGLDEKGVTIFAKTEDGKPFLYDYVIKGFFKNACKAMREVEGSRSKGLSAYKTKIDNLVFVEPRKILFDMPEGSEITICQRPLRANTPQGERTALAASECIPAGSTLECTIHCLNKEMYERVPEWLNYGRWNGLGQWHNSGRGRLLWQDITTVDEE